MIRADVTMGGALLARLKVNIVNVGSKWLGEWMYVQLQKNKGNKQASTSSLEVEPSVHYTQTYMIFCALGQTFTNSATAWISGSWRWHLNGEQNDEWNRNLWLALPSIFIITLNEYFTKWIWNRDVCIMCIIFQDEENLDVLWGENRWKWKGWQSVLGSIPSDSGLFILFYFRLIPSLILFIPTEARVVSILVLYA